MKVRTTISIDGEVVEEAKAQGINISQFCEDRLREIVFGKYARIHRIYNKYFRDIPINRESKIELNTGGEISVLGVCRMIESTNEKTIVETMAVIKAIRRDDVRNAALSALEEHMEVKR